jgi:hypothetical protein
VNYRDIALACCDAIEGEEDCPGGLDNFRAIVTPDLVLRLIDQIGAAAPSDEVEELRALVGVLADYMERVSDPEGAMSDEDRKTLVMRARLATL